MTPTLASFSAPGHAVDLSTRIEVQIHRRSGGQIRDLHVVCVADLVILRGHSRTYHAKQLAQEAALDESGEHTTLANQIVVG